MSSPNPSTPDNNPHTSAQREVTGARRVGVDFKSGEENRRESAMPEMDAAANTMYLARPKGAPNSQSKPLGPRPVALSLNSCNQNPLGNRHVQRAR